MRSFLFNLAYWGLSISHTIAAAFAAVLPGRGSTRRVIGAYTRRMVRAMETFAGIRLEVRGRERLPEGGFILAAKHQSWGDGFCIYSQFDDLAFVTGDHLEKFPFVGRILSKLGAIVVDSCGGPESRKAMTETAAQARAEGRRILIYPEGHLAKVGERYRYRLGVFQMYRDFEMPVIPVATNLGVFWPQEAYEKRPGTAVLEFLEPIPVGLDKAEFMSRLESVVEGRTAQLVAEATGEPVRPSVLAQPAKSRPRRAEASG